MNFITHRSLFGIFTAFFVMLCASAIANIPGGGTGTGPDVTLVDNGDGTVTMSNGIISIHINKTSAVIDQINYTFNNTGTSQTLNVLSGGNDGGQLYWEFGGFGSGTPTYSVVANTGDYAEVSMFFDSAASGAIDIHFSMLRGSTGFYVTPIWLHRSQDAAMTMGECRDNIYSGSIFNWMSVDARRNRLMAVSPANGAVGVQGAPVECSLWTNGIYAGQYEDKYKYSADYSAQHAWGWSSVGTGGENIGLWDIAGSDEYMPGGPMKRELMCHIGTTILNTPHGSHYGGGTDSSWNSGEVWAKVCGPHFIYCNAITNTITVTNVAAQALYQDALAQSAAEQSAWPYSWFNNSNYTPASGRGAVAGQIVIQDIYNPDASASNLWVGVEQQPNPASTGTYDFQEWYKPYQFWVRTDANGNFVIPNVIAGANYTLYAFGPGAAGTFQSQAQTGGNAPNELDIPSTPFSVTVTAGATNNLNQVVWTPSRVGPTVFEIGYPDRTGGKFRHGDDWWVGDIGPGPTNPMPVWTKFLEYPFDFPNGPDYTVGSSHWATDWNFVQPCVVDTTGNYDDSSATINFNLASAPSGTASFYLALSSDYQGAIEVSVNGTAIAGSSGYDPAYLGSGNESDATIREGIHGIFSDNRINFSASLLKTGQNTITIGLRQTSKVNGDGYFADHAMYDYIRLELTGYIPPPPGSVTTYPGNQENLICWPAQSGATSYNVLRALSGSSSYSAIATGVTGPVCGSGPDNVTWVDSNAVNGVSYNYAVQSVNDVGASSNSPSSAATTAGSYSTSPPAVPASVTIGSVAHQSVTVNWSASANANFYTIYRSTLVNSGGGSSNVLSTIVLDNTNTTTSYTDHGVTDGSIYSYDVTATSAAGTSTNSATAVGVPLPVPPATAPGSFSGIFNSSSVVLNWSAVSGAVGYIISRGTSSNGPFTYVQNVTETTYTDAGLDASLTYYYEIRAVNAAGVSANSSATVVPPPGAPISLSAFPGNAQVVLSWTPVGGITGYYLYGGTSSGQETNLVVADWTGTTYTNTGLVNGTTYYYVVASTNASGLGPNSPEASATPNVNIVITPRSLTWEGDGAANIWDVSGADNCQTGGVRTIFNNGDTLTFDNTGSVPVTIAGTPQPALVIFNASKNYTLDGPGSISGTNALVKTGSGTLTINNTNLYSGGTIISNSTVIPGNVAANSMGWGTGPITLAGGTVDFNGYGSRDSGNGWGGCTNTFNVPAGQTGTLLLPARFGYASPFTSALTGGGTLNVTVEYVRDYFGGDWSAFTGQINVSAPASGAYYNTGDFRINNSKGYANAAIYLNNSVNLYNINGNNETIDIGELGGSTAAFIGAGSVSSLNPVWRIGAKNTTNTYAGVIADAGVTSLIKIGTGALILSGANTYSGGTTISGGTLVVGNSAGSATGAGSVTVNTGGTLAGSGLVAGPVTVNSGGVLAPGSPLGTLTVSNTLTLASGSATLMTIRALPHNNATVNVTNTLAEGGTLVVTNLGGTLANGQSFQLFNAASITGNFSSFVLPSLTGKLVWNTSQLNTAGTLSIVTLTSPAIASFKRNGSNLVIAGSGGVSNWPYYVLAATNLVGAPWIPVATNQFDNSGNFSLTLTNAFVPASPDTFYRLQLQ